MRCSRQRARSRSLIARRRIERRSQLRVLLPPTAGVLRSRVIRDNPVERELQEKSVRIEQSFIVKRPPEVVFDYLTDPANLADWRTSKTAVEKLTEGPPRLGTRVRERTKPPGGREFEQIVEFTMFERPRDLHVHIVEGPYPVDAIYRFEPTADGTQVHFATEGRLRGAARPLEPIAKRMLARQMRAYHENLRRSVEAR